MVGWGKSGDEEPIGLRLPDIKKVKEEEWNKYELKFDKYSATEVMPDVIVDKGKDKTIYTFYVNVDNIYLKTDMKNSKSDPALIESKFIFGNVLTGLALINDYEECEKIKSRNDKNNRSYEKETIYERIKNTTKALSPFLIPMIDNLGALTDEDVSSFGEIGDQV